MSEKFNEIVKTTLTTGYHKFSTAQSSLSLFQKVSICFLAVTIAYLYTKWRYNKQMTLFYKPTKRNKAILKKLSSRLSSYNPTFYLPFSIMKLLVTGKSPRLKDKRRYLREYVTMQDGEVIALDIYPKNHKDLPKDTPTLLFIPGLNGTSTNNYSKKVSDYVEEMGLKWRVVMMNKRGFEGTPILGNRITILDIYWDINDVVQHLTSIFPSSSLYVFGWSLGAAHVVNYLKKFNAPKNMKAAFILGCPWNWHKTSVKVRKTYIVDHSLTKKNLSLAIDHIHEPHFKTLMKKKGITPDDLFEPMTAREADFRVLMKDSGHKTQKSYHDALSCHLDVDKIDIPLFCLQSKSDLVCEFDGAPVEVFEKSDNMIFVAVNGGGHVSFFSGVRARYWSIELGLDYLRFMANFEGKN